MTAIAIMPQHLRDPYRFCPIFVLAPARSFSSVAVSMLGQHPQLYGFPELRLFRAAKVAGLLAEPKPAQGMPARERNSGLVRAIAQLHHGEQSQVSVERAWDWLRCRNQLDVHEILDHLLALIAPRAGIEKSPETSLTHEALDRVLLAYPAARFIHLVRHPWTTVASMTLAWGRLSYWDVPSDQAPEFCTRVWLEQHLRIDTLEARVEPERFMQLRAEDLINKPEQVLPELCRKLGLESSEDHIAPMLAPEKSLYASLGPPNASGGFDPTFLRNPRRRDVGLPSSLVPPPAWSLDEMTRVAAVSLAREYGYQDLPENRGWRSRGRVRRFASHYRRMAPSSGNS